MGFLTTKPVSAATNIGVINKVRSFTHPATGKQFTFALRELSTNYIYISTNGGAYTKTTVSSDASSYFDDVAFDGVDTFILVGRNSTANAFVSKLKVASNGSLSLTGQQASTIKERLKGAVWHPTNKMFYAIGDGMEFVSIDPSTISITPIGRLPIDANYTPTDIAINNRNSRIAVSIDDGTVWSTPDLVTWQQASFDVAPTGKMNGILWDNRARRWFAFGAYTKGFWASTDGLTFTTISTEAISGSLGNSMIRLGDQLILVSRYRIYSSLDNGVTWAREYYSTTNTFYTVTYNAFTKKLVLNTLGNADSIQTFDYEVIDSGPPIDEGNVDVQIDNAATMTISGINPSVYTQSNVEVQVDNVASMNLQALPASALIETPVYASTASSTFKAMPVDVFAEYNAYVKPEMKHIYPSYDAEIPMSIYEFPQEKQSFIRLDSTNRMAIRFDISHLTPDTLINKLSITFPSSSNYYTNDTGWLHLYPMTAPFPSYVMYDTIVDSIGDEIAKVAVHDSTSDVVVRSTPVMNTAVLAYIQQCIADGLQYVDMLVGWTHETGESREFYASETIYPPKLSLDYGEGSTTEFVDIELVASTASSTMMAMPTTVELSLDANIRIANAASMSMYAPQVVVKTERSVNVQAGTAHVHMNAMNAHVSIDSTIHADTATMRIKAIAPIVSTATKVEIPVDVATMSLMAMPVEVVTEYNAIIHADVATMRTQAFTPSVYTVSHTVISVGVATSTLTALPVEVINETVVRAECATMAIHAYSPHIQVDVSIEADIATSTLIAPPVEVFASQANVVMADVATMSFIAFPSTVQIKENVEHPINASICHVNSTHSKSHIVLVERKEERHIKVNMVEANGKPFVFERHSVELVIRDTRNTVIHTTPLTINGDGVVSLHQSANGFNKKGNYKGTLMLNDLSTAKTYPIPVDDHFIISSLEAEKEAQLNDLLEYLIEDAEQQQIIEDAKRREYDVDEIAKYFE